jgi:DNA-binding FadR family transcriptional regulator
LTAFVGTGSRVAEWNERGCGRRDHRDLRLVMTHGPRWKNSPARSRDAALRSSRDVISDREAWEMTMLRSLVEAQALEWAIPQMTKADFDSAERHLNALDKAKRTDDIIALNGRFHSALYAACRRERTLSLIGSLRLNFERYLRFTWEETLHRDRSQREHRQIMIFCKRGDGLAACSLLKEHIVGTGRLLVEHLGTVQERQSGMTRRRSSAKPLS